MLLHKKIIFTALLSLIALNFITIAHGNHHTIYLPTSCPTIEDVTHQTHLHKPVILWDLHKVVFDHVMSRMLFYKRPNQPSHWWSLAKETLFSVFSPNTYRHLYQQASHGSKITQSYFDAFKNYPTLYAALLRLANDIHLPNTKVVALIKQLHDNHYPQYIFSNIGPTILKDLQTEYPELFSYFSDYKNAINNSDPYHGPWLCKPRPEAYGTAYDFVKNLTGISQAHQIIFIDDKLENIKAAQAAGMIGILYRNPEQLRQDLIRLGLFK